MSQQKLHFLHLKNKVKEKIPNQTALQQLGGLTVLGHQEKNIRQQDKECVVFQHEDFGGQLIWALQCYVSINMEGPEESFFDQQQDADAAAPPPPGGATGEEQQQEQHEEQQQEHHPVIQEMVVHTHLNNNDAAVAAVVACMVDNDNEPGPENCPVANETVDDVDDIFHGWLHSGICECRSTVHQDSQAELNFWTSSETEPTNLYLLEALFFKLHQEHNYPHNKQEFGGYWHCTCSLW